MSYVLVIDLDPAVYAAGFASEIHSYELILEDPEGNLVQEHWADGNKMKKWKQENIKDGDWVLLEQTKLVTPMEAWEAKEIAGSAIGGCVKNVEEHYGEASQVITLLTGKDNFRDKIATIAPYKGNRDSMIKPVHYETIRKYFADEWGARVIDGREADDEASIICTELRESGKDYVVATIDKDLDQIPGKHYDYNKKVFYDVGEEAARLFFYQQILSGDAVDNIPGLNRIGAVKAAKLIQNAIDMYSEVSFCYDSLEQKLWDYCVASYEKVGVKNYTGKKTPYELALETARLVKMQDYRGQLWTPPGVEDELLEVQLDD